MNQVNDYLAYNPDREEPDLDLKDLFAYILLHWKKVLLCSLVFALFGCVIAFLRATTPLPLDTRLESARAQLTEEQAADIESLHARYVGYQAYRRSLQDDYARYLSNASLAEDHILLNASYYLISKLEGLETVLPQILLSEDDYNAMQVISKEEEEISSIYSRIRINSSRSFNVSGSGTVINILQNSDGPFVNYYFLITLYGSSAEECESLLTIVDAAVSRTAESLRTLDPDLSLQMAGREFSHNTRDYVNQQISENKTILNDIESQLISLTTNHISKLSSAQKEYYDLLDEDPDIADLASKHVSWKKWSLLGTALGFMFGICICIIDYLFDGKVKRPEEANLLFNVKTLKRISIPGRKNLFGRWISLLVGSNPTSFDDTVHLLVTDIQLLMEKSNHTHLYLLCDPDDRNSYHIAEAVKSQLSSQVSSLTISLGNPSVSVHELQSMSSSEAVVSFEELRNSSRKMLVIWSELCERHHLSIIGNVAVEVCW